MFWDFMSLVLGFKVGKYMGIYGIVKAYNWGGCWKWDFEDYKCMVG